MAAAADTKLGEIAIADFSGGWNIRDAPSELQPNESPDLLNVTVDERGGITKRLGQEKYNATVFSGSALVTNTFYWPSGKTVVTQAGASVYNGSSTIAFHTFTTSARVDFAEFAGKLWIVHPVDGVYQSDGTTGGTTAVAGSPAGQTIIAWQNRLLVGSSTSPTLHASTIGDATDWTTASGHGWTNDIREVNDAGIVSLAAASGVDILGRPGLIVCKGPGLGTYRVYDSNTGAYQTLDPGVGAASALATANLFGETIVLSTQGIFTTNGTGPLKIVSERIQPLFNSAEIAFDQADLFCAGTVGDRVKFSLPRAGETANTLSLEYHPLQGWIVPGTDAASCYTTFRDADEQLLAGSPTAAGQVYRQGTGGSDDGAPIVSYFQTRWFKPNNGFRSQLWQLRIDGRGSGSIYVRKDYTTAGGVERQFSLVDMTPSWDTGVDWDNTIYTWGPEGFQQSQPFYNLETARAFSVRVEETSSLTGTGQQIGGAGAEPTVGAWAVYGMSMLHVPLGIA